MVFQLHLDTEKVEHIDLPSAFCVDPDATVREVFDQLRDENARGSAVICRDGRLIGIFTERDALRLMAAGTNLDQPIQEVMNPLPATIAATETVEAAIELMSEGGYRRLPVINENREPVGMLTVSSILHYLVQHFPKSVYNLPPSPDQNSQRREGA